MHRIYVGLSRIAFNAVGESDDDFFCHFCGTKCMSDEIKALRERISSLEEITQNALYYYHGDRFF